MRMLDVPPVWLALFAAAAWLIAGAEPASSGFGGLWARIVGIDLILAGLVLFALALSQMARARTTVIPRREAAALVTSGIFRFSRNPIYLGDALILLGVILILDAPLALPLVPAFMLFIARRFIAGEEAMLRAKFGPAFEAYAARTRRWL